MTGISFEIRLCETGWVDGEIAALDLAKLCESLQELATRVGRWVCEAGPQGRLPKDSEEITRVHITGLAPGSTRLTVSTELSQPMIDETSINAAEIDARFWDIIRGNGFSDSFPSDAPLFVRESASKFLNSMKSAKQVVITGRSDGLDSKPIHFDPKDVANATWFSEVMPEPMSQEKVVTGRLEMVDISKNHFRILEPDGTTVDIQDVPDPWKTSHLVTQYVVAIGAVQQIGRKTIMRAPVIERSDLLDFRTESTAQEEAFWAATRSAQPYDPEKVVPFELTDEEWDAFWEVLHDE